MNASEKLKSLREAKGMSQADCAKAMNIDRTTYAKYETGGSIRRNVEKLAAFFNVSVDYLLGRTGEPHTIAKGSSSTDLTPKEEREIEHDLEDMINSMASAAYESDNGEQEDIEALQATLRAAMIQAKRIAKKIYPKKIPEGLITWMQRQR